MTYYLVLTPRSIINLFFEEEELKVGNYSLILPDIIWIELLTFISLGYIHFHTSGVKWKDLISLNVGVSFIKYCNYLWLEGMQ